MRITHTTEVSHLMKRVNSYYWRDEIGVYLFETDLTSNLYGIMSLRSEGENAPLDLRNGTVREQRRRGKGDKE